MNSIVWNTLWVTPWMNFLLGSSQKRGILTVWYLSEPFILHSPLLWVPFTNYSRNVTFPWICLITLWWSIWCCWYWSSSRSIRLYVSSWRWISAIQRSKWSGPVSWPVWCMCWCPASWERTFMAITLTFSSSLSLKFRAWNPCSVLLPRWSRMFFEFPSPCSS